MDIKQMFADLKSSLRQGDFWRMLAVAAVITVLMSGYFLAIGIPKTRARNLHNEDSARYLEILD